MPCGCAAAKICVLGLILSSSPYLRSAKARFPLVTEVFEEQPGYTGSVKELCTFQLGFALSRVLFS